MCVCVCSVCVGVCVCVWMNLNSPLGSSGRNTLVLHTDLPSYD